MRNTKGGLLAAAVIAMMGAGLEVPGPRLAAPVRQRYRPKRNTEQEREIAEWNEAVDRRRAEKLARKGKQ